MSLNAVPQSWKNSPPPVRGRIHLGTNLGRMTWFRVGGDAEVLFRPADEEDLAFFLTTLPEEVPVTVMGVGSNLLVRDGGIPGVVIRFGGPFAEARLLNNQRIEAGAGALDTTVAMLALESGLTGLEFLSGIPGTIGGALRMNAGAYNRETKDIFVEAVALDRQGNRHVLDMAAMGFGYRRCSVPDSWLFTRAVLQGAPGDVNAVAEAMKTIRDQRTADQPQHVRTGGSTFANPEGARAWELIDRAGCRGLKIGGAQVSEKHCNFLINTGDATAADIEALGEEVHRRVLETCGVDLHWEIRRVGIATEGEAA